MLKVSIIMPCYNGSKFISKSISSVLQQTIEDWELIITDDASEDNSIDIIQKFALRDPRIKFFSLKHSVGAGPARNVSMKAATGEYLAFLDCDDIWTSDKLERQLNQMEAFNYSFSCTHYNVIDDRAQYLGKVCPSVRSIDFKRHLKINDIGCSTAMIKRSLVSNKYEFPNYPKGQDFVFWAYFLRDGHDCFCVPEFLASYRIHSDSRTKNKLKVAINRVKLMNKALNIPVITLPYYVICYFIFGIIKQRRATVDKRRN